MIRSIRDFLLLAAVASASPFFPAKQPIAQQQPFLPTSQSPAIINHPLYVPRIDYTALDKDDDGSTPPPEGMVLHPLHISGKSVDRVDLTFFADGYTEHEQDKFVADAQKLTDEIVSAQGSMNHVSHLLNIWGVFVPSNSSGVGVYDQPIPGAAFGLYRSGAELRGVYVQHHRRARAACRHFGEGIGLGGCDQPIILGNDPLYGGLGGEFTIITASSFNGPLVLRHELGHSLIPVGEEYEGGTVYRGVNADKVKNVGNLKWKKFLSDPENVRVEDAKVPLQVYPWYNLTKGPYSISFHSSNPSSSNSFHVEKPYPNASMQISLSSIPYPSHINLTLNSKEVNLSSVFPDLWAGSLDRRWLEVPLPDGLPAGENVVDVSLTDKGLNAVEGQGGKMITSMEIMEYGGGGRFNAAKGFIGAFPTYDINGNATLRPMNQECLMRKVNHPTFCPVCAAGLEDSLKEKIKAKKHKNHMSD